MSRQPHIHTHNCGCTAEMRGSGALSSLYGAINMDKVVTLNEAKKDTGKGILKPYDNRRDNTITVQSSCDGELLFQIPFTVSIKLNAVTVRAVDSSSQPCRLRLWANRQDIDFESAGTIKPSQTINISYDEKGDIQYPTRATQFSNVDNITILLDQCAGDGELSLAYLGLFGAFTTHRHGVVDAMVELWANPADHKKASEDSTNQSTIM